MAAAAGARFEWPTGGGLIASRLFNDAGEGEAMSPSPMLYHDVLDQLELADGDRWWISTLARASASPLGATFCFVATSNPFHSLLSPTTRGSILLIRSERSASAAFIAAVVCRKVLTFDPNDTIPPSTTAIDPIAAT